MNRTDRLYALTEELRRAGPAGRTSAQLADRFEVAARTIKRDVTALQEAGVPIWATAGPGGGYALDPAATLPPLTFSAREATALAVALALSRDLPFAPDGRTALTKLLGAMRPEDREAAAALGGRVLYRSAHGAEADGSPLRPPRPAAARVVDEAIRDQVVVVLDYTDADGRSTERRPVEPLTYALTGERWYLLGWCRRRRGGRWFRLDRIDRAVLTTERVAPRDLEEVFGPVPAGVGPVVLDPA
ncbi:WYL domain-containing protein [Iamia majanohamensis]|uniref:WYL domain-containing protein n=1 Tax=Iamia majanohamensis TaxID=467976 RepID=A0AAE9Y5D7_9ACTN|nr:WYL domain-containing protein [Iamia majanohamensis]WCO67040.1 WYL domain-containing protein [Iamia majanohamensis]